MPSASPRTQHRRLPGGLPSWCGGAALCFVARGLTPPAGAKFINVLLGEPKPERTDNSRCASDDVTQFFVAQRRSFLERDAVRATKRAGWNVAAHARRVLSRRGN